jgi:hypothetical protein
MASVTLHGWERKNVYDAPTRLQTADQIWLALGHITPTWLPLLRVLLHFVSVPTTMVPAQKGLGQASHARSNGRHPLGHLHFILVEANVSFASG